MALKRIKGTFFTSFEGRRYTFRAGTVVDESHPALSNALRKRYSTTSSTITPFSLPPLRRRPLSRARGEMLRFRHTFLPECRLRMAKVTRAARLT